MVSKGLSEEYTVEFAFGAGELSISTFDDESLEKDLLPQSIFSISQPGMDVRERGWKEMGKEGERVERV
jgi:hypothetical protein